MRLPAVGRRVVFVMSASVGMEKVNTVAGLLTRGRLHPTAVVHADRAQTEAPSQPWCIAFSGGADSLALLILVLAHWPGMRSSLVALHFNHRLRGEASDADERFCREVCAALGVSLRVGQWENARADAGETEAREARQRFFANAMESVGAKILWTGHHRDDVAETLLMRIARGSSSAGLAAPRPVQQRRDGRCFLRPLIAISRQEIEDALRAAKLTWREDATNAGRDFFRNRVRHDVLPALKKAAENDALAGVALTRELLDEDDAALETWLAELMPDGSGATDTSLDLRPLVGRPRALWRRALRRWTPLTELARAGFEDVLALCLRGYGRANAGDGWVEMCEGVLYFQSATDGDESSTAWAAVSLVVGGRLFLPDGGRLTAQSISLKEARELIAARAIDVDREALVATNARELRVRRKRVGDRYHPLGAPGSAKLQDLFVNRKIPVSQRQIWPLVCEPDEKIVWIPGFPPAEGSKITDTSVTVVRLTYEIGTHTVHPQSQRVNVRS